MDKSNPPGGGIAELYELLSARSSATSTRPSPAASSACSREAPVHRATRAGGPGDPLAVRARRHARDQRAALPRAARRPTPTRDRRRAARVTRRYLDACLQRGDAAVADDRRCSPARRSRDIDWDGITVPAGTQLLIVNTFNHRDRERLDRSPIGSTPEAWLDGERRGRLAVQPLQPRPAGLPGRRRCRCSSARDAAGRASSATRAPRLRAPSPRPGKPLPHALDYFALRFELRCAAETALDAAARLASDVSDAHATSRP